ncbi:polysaccharide deacetylase family protein [Virgibacillus sp. C22-A2]|uniref:Polysaccharide deacetylase family protein n=1 Tax=Virgibacillus tibetensis TaxID=3042313 RepID=A0ABU6KDF9_9BACI|nr:polysaccharide deacetylase family protein [Virgibacillus sp. C22-A2]
MHRLSVLVVLCVAAALIQGCSQQIMNGSSLVIKEIAIAPKSVPKLKEEDLIDLSPYDREPTEWGEQVKGVKTQMQTNERKIALTFDACGGDHGNGYDEELLLFLKEEKIPATLFVNERWIHANEALFLDLADNPLFQIENHGTHHSPLSVNGGEAWGIPATQSPQEAYNEIMQNHDTVKGLTGREMAMFRSGTAYYDEVAVELAVNLGYDVVNFDVLGDAGATYSGEQVKNALLGSQKGSIVLLHMNQPGSGTAEGVKLAIPLLRDQGFEFVLLEDEILK